MIDYISGFEIQFSKTKKVTPASYFSVHCETGLRQILYINKLHLFCFLYFPGNNLDIGEQPTCSTADRCIPGHIGMVKLEFNLYLV